MLLPSQFRVYAASADVMSFIKAVKRPVRKLGARLGLLRDWDAHFAVLAEPGKERDSDYYDTLYIASDTYHSDYTQSEYYFLWSVIVDRILKAPQQDILEVGCGPGQLAAYLHDCGVSSYLGFDFSEKAIELAKKQNCPNYTFLVDNALTCKLFESTPCSILICTEVLEHLDQDLELVERFPKGARCLCTVPNFPFSSHVRYFNDAHEVSERYSLYFDEFSVSTFRGVRNKEEKFFLLDGRKK